MLLFPIFGTISNEIIVQICRYFTNLRGFREFNFNLCKNFAGHPTAAAVDLPFKDIVQVLLIGPSIFAGLLLLTHMVGMRGVGDPSSPTSPTVRDTCCQPRRGGVRDSPSGVLVYV
jgi:hypothetical protein